MALDKTDYAALIERGELTVQYTVVDGVARLVVGGRDSAAAEYVEALFIQIREDEEPVDPAEWVAEYEALGHDAIPFDEEE